jgi:hypothetical protein
MDSALAPAVTFRVPRVCYAEGVSAKTMKRLIGVSGEDLTERDVIATFRLVGDRVEIDAPQDVQRGMGLHRIYYRRVLSPSDGLAYYEALEVAFSNSTYCYVDTVPDEHSPGLDGERS